MQPQSVSSNFSDLLTSNGIIKSLLSKVACLVWRIENLVVEDGEVESKTKADWVGWCKISLGNLSSVLVSLKRLVSRLLSLVTNGELGEVTVVVTLPIVVLVVRVSPGEGDKHLVVENLRLPTLSRWNQVLVKDLKDIFADLGQLCLDCLTVVLDEANLYLVSLGLFLLLNRGNNSPRSAAGTNNVLVSN